ncbi:methionine synthase [bacterium DOLJORAL78_65_58]|nr:MAG: methionine synthase [bacterium DOLJORAL78_65_58]
MSRLTRRSLAALAARRILVLDGAMGTMIQSYDLQEADFRGTLLADHPVDLKGNNDLLCLTRPDVIGEIHRGYLEAGADIITTNTFNGTSVAQSDYRTTHLVRDINVAAARLAREAADEQTARTPDRPRFVAGSLAPTNRTCSISPDVNNPGLRNITFTELVTAYSEEAAALLDGGVDILMIETVFDPLNAKAAVFACRRLLRARGQLDVPLWISGTITDASGRTLTGQTPAAFWTSMRHAGASIFGLNCALGATAMRPFVEDISWHADTLVSAHPNAGLPNELGGYDETPDQMAGILADFADAGLLNIAGGCCGTTPDFIRAIDRALAGKPPRTAPPRRSGTWLAGLEPLNIGDGSLFVNVGERTNVAGSRRFARLISDGKLEEALEVGRKQVRGGAQIVDVNMDDAMLDSVACMGDFLNVLASDPEISRVPVMIDSSRWDVLEAGLQRIQGKGVVNSLSLKDGEDAFRHHARLVQDYGAAAIIMAFDEDGQADTLERRVAICTRAYRILVDEEGWDPEDIIFDPNVFAVATGLPEHDRYAVDFIEACRRIKAELPGARISGGISNLSFSFRGNDTVREAMHSVFLYHAIAAGLDMGIVNAGQLAVYEEIEPRLLEAVEDVILARKEGATDRLIELATRTAGKKVSRKEDLSWREKSVSERLAHALLTGDTDYIEEDTLAALEELGQPIRVIEGPLMAGLNHVGELFGAGKMFLPQVIRSARVMKRAVGLLESYLEADAAGAAAGPKVLMATVKGDVHDIGKNIVSVVLACNGYRIIDLGVMVPVDKILETALAEKVVAVGLSGLITPSLAEMGHVADQMQRVGLKVPLLVGGATTSGLHTALKIAPNYPPGVYHVKDASQAAGLLSRLLNPDSAPEVVQDYRRHYAEIRDKRATETDKRPLLDLEEARRRAPKLSYENRPVVREPGIKVLDSIDLGTLREFIDWTPFFRTWRLMGTYPAILEDEVVGAEARRLFADAESLLTKIMAEGSLQARAVIGLFPAARQGDDLILYEDASRAAVRARIPFLRQQRRSAARRPNFSLVDFVAPEGDFAGAFACTAGLGAAQLAAAYDAAGDDYSAILVKALADRLAEACAEWLHLRVRREWWGYAPDEPADTDLIAEEYRGIRPAPGYPACPDHFAKKALFALLGAEKNAGMSLTENGSMDPAASVSGWYFAHPEARYFGIGRIGRDQVADYARRCGITEEEAALWLTANLD